MKPLAGLHMVVTRAAHQAEDLAAPLRELGARVTVLPAIGIAPPHNPEPLLQAARSLGSFDWIVFTSANAVRALALQIPAEEALRPRAAAIGPATREAALAAGFPVKITADTYIAESLVEAIGHAELIGQRVLIPAAAVTRDIVPAELRKRGAQVTVVEAYRNICPPETIVLAPQVFAPPIPDWVLFASPSAFENLLPLIESDVLTSTRIASIGPVTTAAIVKHGYSVDVEARPQTIPALVDGILNAVGSTPPHH